MNEIEQRGVFATLGKEVLDFWVEFGPPYYLGSLTRQTVGTVIHLHSQPLHIVKEVSEQVVRDFYIPKLEGTDWEYDCSPSTYFPHYYEVTTD